MRDVKVKKIGSGFEFTRTEVFTVDQANLAARKQQLEAEIKGYQMQLDFLGKKQAEAKEELAQISALLNQP